MFNIYQLIISTVLFAFIAAKIRQKHLSILFLLCSAVLVVLEIIAVYMTGRLIDYRFYNHLNFNAIGGHGLQFSSHFILVPVILICTGWLLHFSAKTIRQTRINKAVFSIPAILVSIFLLSLPNGMFNEFYKIRDIVGAKTIDFNNALNDAGIPPEQYITPDKLTATKGKNILVISVESLEQGFLGSGFSNIAPNLRNLAKNWTFYANMPPMPGGGWTAASLYNHQVGMPAFFKGQSNAFFQGANNAKLTGLGHILNKAGYNSLYLIGNKEFAGIDDLLRTYGIPAVSAKNTLGTYPRNIYGLHDLDLFQEAKLQIQALKQDETKPFALFMSTVNTHFPNGIYDQRMEEFTPRRHNNMEFSVSAVDYLIHDLIAFLKKENLYDSTAVFIFPDHLLMGSGGTIINTLRQSERRLYLITNASESTLPRKTTDTLYQIDLPRMILAGAEIHTNANFLSDFIEPDHTIQFINTHAAELSALNAASLEKINYKKGIDIRIADNTLRISSGKNHIVFTLNKKQTHEFFDVTFNSEMVVITKKKRSYTDVFDMTDHDEQYHRLHLIISTKNGKIDRTYLGNKQRFGLYKKGDHASYSENNIHLITESNDAQQEEKNFLAQQDEKDNRIINTYRQDTHRFIAHAGGMIDEHAYTDSLDALNASYRNGFRMFELDIIKTSDNVYVAAHDWKHWAEITHYKGPLPPNRETFLRQKIHGKYTPMDIHAINKWFTEHPDATLVTDKVNSPADFSRKFVDKNRLMMELFSWTAVKEGIEAKIKAAMPTMNILSQIKGDKIAFLKGAGITYIASSRRILNKYKGAIKYMADIGIKIYAFHINYDQGIDETYVVCNEHPYFYGMYADKWNFNTPLKCPPATTKAK